MYQTFYWFSFLKGISGEMQTTERYVKLKLQKTTSFIVVESLDVLPEHTNLLPARCFDASEVPWISLSLSFFNHDLSEFKVRPVSLDCRDEADWLRRRCATNLVSLLASRHPICHSIPAPLIFAPLHLSNNCR
jgi:hypothetical protein